MTLVKQEPPSTPGDALTDIGTRVRNMAGAAGMIVFLLLRMLLVKVIGERLRVFKNWLLYRLAVALATFFKWFQPHWERLNRLAQETSHRWLRQGLALLITWIGPLERRLGQWAGVVRQQSSQLATRGTLTVAELLRGFFNALGAALAAGFSRPAVQRLMQRIAALLEEAQR
ncbi:MAG: hypothetical protein VKP62_05530 [Candidatus Sericytochromatia bacterium]|nr:hypothetical protein [Candidatus Sericytochromatia bacterium]